MASADFSLRRQAQQRNAGVALSGVRREPPRVRTMTFPSRIASSALAPLRLARRSFGSSESCSPRATRSGSYPSSGWSTHGFVSSLRSSSSGAGPPTSEPCEASVPADQPQADLAPRSLRPCRAHHSSVFPAESPRMRSSLSTAVARARQADRHRATLAVSSHLAEFGPHTLTPNPEVQPHPPGKRGGA